MKERAGIIMDYVATKTMKVGVPVVVGTVVGVPNKDAVAGDLVALTCEGVLELKKDNAEIEQGAVVYVDDAGVCTATDTGNTKAGVCWEEADTSATTVMVKLNA